MTSIPLYPKSNVLDAMRKRWCLALGAVALSLPALAALSSGYWSTEQGAGGSIVLVSGAWLLWHEGSKLQRPEKPVSLWPVFSVIAIFGTLSLIASVAGIVWIQVAATYLCLIAMLASLVGWRGVGKIWAPVAYLAFIIPLPDIVMVVLTHGLKLFIANSSISFLATMGYPVAREGSYLFIGHYELVVAAACAGMNSMVSLTALCLFYVYCLHRANWSYSIVLCLLSIPLAIMANWLRVVIIMLVTYYLGDAVGQGILHELTGAMLFIFAMGGMIAVDAVLARTFRPLRRMPA